MGFRFRRSLKILPGVRLNISRSGISTSVGVKGAHITAGHGRVRETVSLPGSGISYTESQSTRQAAPDAQGEAQGPDGANHWSLLGRIVRVVLYGLLAFWLLSVLVVWLIARFWRRRREIGNGIP